MNELEKGNVTFVYRKGIIRLFDLCSSNNLWW